MDGSMDGYDPKKTAGKALWGVFVGLVAYVGPLAFDELLSLLSDAARIEALSAGLPPEWRPVAGILAAGVTLAAKNWASNRKR